MKNQIKKILAVVLALLVAFSLVACGSEPETEIYKPESEGGKLIPPGETLDEPSDGTEDDNAKNSTGSTSAKPSAQGKKVVEIAKDQIGKPFSFGGVGPDSFDAPGFVQYCFKGANTSIPRVIADQAVGGKEIKFEKVALGDVLIFFGEDPQKPQFSGIYVGDNKMIACLNEDKPVAEIVLGNYYMEHLFSVRRY